MTSHSITQAADFLFNEAQTEGWICRSWTISELDLAQLREESGGDVPPLRGLPYTVSENDEESLTLHATRAVPVSRDD